MDCVNTNMNSNMESRDLSSKNEKYAHDVFISFSFKDQLIADQIVNLLQNKYNIRCWICTADIRAGTYFYEKIAEAIIESKILVFVQTKNSVESTEIPDEIVMAINEGKTIISFIVDDSQLHLEMKLKLSRRQRIDGTKPTFEDRIEDLAKEICANLGRELYVDGCDLQKSSKYEKLLSTPNVIPKTIFCGREDVLSEIDSNFREGDRVQFLYGIGGIGKTQIAKQYAKQYKKNYDTIIYATYNGSIREMIVAESPFSFEPEMIRYTLSDGSQENDNDFFERKLSKIKKASKEKTLIIIDNFDVEDDPDLSLLLDGKYHLLITTRCDYSRYYPTIKVKPIDSLDALKDIFMKNYQGDEVESDDPALVELIELVNRHTYTIELLAQHMENSGQTPDEVITALKEQGITSLNEEVRDAEMKTQVAYENLLKMFKVFSLSEEERQLLMYLSLMPIEGVDVKDFKDWANLKSSRLIKNLENRSWIIRNTNGIAMHPIIRSVIKHEIPATADNCSDFISSFTNNISELNSWHFKKVDKDKYASIAKRLLSVFKEITPITEQLYYLSEVLFSFAVDPEYAVELARRLYDYYLSYDRNKTYEIGRAAFKLGWVYAYNTHLPNSVNEALKWLEKAEEILSKITLVTSREKASYSQVMVNLAKMHLSVYEQTNKENELVLSKKYAEANVEFSKEAYVWGDPQYAKLAGAYWQLADVQRTAGEYEQSLQNIDKSLDILLRLNGEDDGDTTHAMNRKAAILYSIGKYSEAKPMAQKSTTGYVEFFGENHPTIVGMYKLIGDCCIALDESIEAKIAYEKALEIAERLYSPEAKQIAELRECLI